MTDTNPEAKWADIHNKLHNLADAYRADADLRARAEAEPRAVIAENGLDTLAPPSADVRIVANTGDTIHILFPADPNTEVADEEFGNISGGWGGWSGCAQSAQSAASAGMCYSSAW